MLFTHCTQSTIYHTPLTGQEALTDTSTDKQSVLLGLTELSWNLTDTEGRLNRGRYLEELVFMAQPKTPQNETEISYEWMMGYRDPSLTTYPSDVLYSLAVAAIIAPKDKMVVSSTLWRNSCKKHVLLYRCQNIEWQMGVCAWTIRISSPSTVASLVSNQAHRTPLVSTQN